MLFLTPATKTVEEVLYPRKSVIRSAGIYIVQLTIWIFPLLSIIDTAIIMYHEFVCIFQEAVRTAP